MSAERVFLGWNGPALPRAAEWLHARFGDDFDKVHVALPGSRAARRLEERLLDACGPAWTPPRLGTIGEITDALVRFPLPRASGLARELAWIAALRDLAEADAAAFSAITTRRPEANDFAGWAALASQVRALHQDLAAEGNAFADVVPCAALPTRERARWRALARVQESFAGLIERCGWCDPHLARLHVLARGEPLRAPRALVLVGVATMNGLQEGIVRRAAEQGTEVLALIVGPEAEAGAFNDLGLLRTAEWSDRAVPLHDAHWRVADRPADQADETVAFLAAACAGPPDARATVAVLRAEIEPFLARRLAEQNSGMRPPVGRMVNETAPGRLLDLLRAFLDRRNPRTFATLVRHPALAEYLAPAPASDLGAACDVYLAAHLPARVDGWWSRAGAAKERRAAEVLDAAHRRLLEWLGSLAEAAERPVTAWPAETSRALQAVFGARLEREESEALEAIGNALEDVAALPEPLTAQRLTAAAFLRLVLHACGRAGLAPDPARKGVEQLGWLELPLDEAPVLAVAGFQVGVAPEAVHGDAFLPEGLRAVLGLTVNADRRARDVWALYVLHHARRALLCVSGQRGTEGDPWLPSPLVFQGADAPARVRAFFRAPEPRASPSGGGATPWGAPPPPAPAPRAQQRFSASQLNLYLKSPRLYWLEQVLGLKTVEPEPHEMDWRVFGNFAHEVLADFARDAECAKLRDPQAIGGAVAKVLKESAARRFGRHPLAAVRLQLAQLEVRLQAWARAEAASRAEGWRTLHVEWEPPAEGVPCIIDGESFALFGRLDRVDLREVEGRTEVRVLDYKAGENPVKPDQAFRPQAQRWDDLQLPVYRRIAIALEPEVGEAARTPLVGWFNLPRGIEATGITPGAWDAGAYALADAAIVLAVRGIRAGEFAGIGRPNRKKLAPALHALLGGLQATDAVEEA